MVKWTVFSLCLHFSGRAQKKTLPGGRVSEFAWTGLLTSREEHFVVLSARVN